MKVNKKRILMLCLGNICRSPLAHGLLDVKIANAHLNWEVDSAGIGHWHIGKLPDKRSIAVAKKYGIDLTYQRARRFEVNDFDYYDLIYAMDHKNFDTLMKLARTEEEKIKVKMIMDEVIPGAHKSVPDPFHDGKEDFEKVFHSLDEATDRMVMKELVERQSVAQHKAEALVNEW